MRPSSGAIITGVLIFITLAIGLVISLFVLISPTQAGQAVLRSSVDVAATAQAIQFRNRQTELEAAGQTQKINWETSITNEQQTLTEFNQNTGVQVAELQTQLDDLRTQIDQVTANLEFTQGNIVELQQSIEADRVNYQHELAQLDQEMTQLEAELQNKLSTTSVALQAAYDKLDTGSPEADTANNESVGDDAGRDEETRDREKSVDDDSDGKQVDDDRSDDKYDEDKSDDDEKVKDEDKKDDD